MLKDCNITSQLMLNNSSQKGLFSRQRVLSTRTVVVIPLIYDIDVKRIFLACPPFTYGEQCLDHCKCKKNNSEKCDAVTGSCHCKTGWTGDTCSQDVDECEDGIRTCNTSLHQVCVNDPGSSHCECLYGGNNLTRCIRKSS